jgi:hypothetical protein
MRLRSTPTRDETLRVCAAFASVSLPPSRAGILTLAVLAVVFVAALLLARPTWLVTFFLSLLSVQAMLYVLKVDSRRQWRLALAGDPHADEPYEIEAGPEGIRVWCAHVDTRYTWDGITRVIETPEFYLFLRGAGGGAWIPKRLLDAAGSEELRRLIRERSPDRGASLAAEVPAPAAPAA